MRFVRVQGNWKNLKTGKGGAKLYYLEYKQLKIEHAVFQFWKNKSAVGNGQNKKRYYLQIKGFVTVNKKKNVQIKLNRALRVG